MATGDVQSHAPPPLSVRLPPNSPRPFVRDTGANSRTWAGPPESEHGKKRQPIDKGYKSKSIRVQPIDKGSREKTWAKCSLV